MASVGLELELYCCQLRDGCHLVSYFPPIESVFNWKVQILQRFFFTPHLFQKTRKSCLKYWYPFPMSSCFVIVNECWYLIKPLKSQHCHLSIAVKANESHREVTVIKLRLLSFIPFYHQIDNFVLKRDSIFEDLVHWKCENLSVNSRTIKLKASSSCGMGWSSPILATTKSPYGYLSWLRYSFPKA